MAAQRTRWAADDLQISITTQWCSVCRGDQGKEMNGYWLLSKNQHRLTYQLSVASFVRKTRSSIHWLDSIREAGYYPAWPNWGGYPPPPRPTRKPVTVPRRRGGNGKLSTSTFLRKSWKFSLKGNSSGHGHVKGHNCHLSPYTETGLPRGTNIR